MSSVTPFKTELLVAALLAAAGPAAAQQTVESDVATFVEHVPFGDLDLTTGSGMATLQHRIRRAARRVCSPSPGFAMDESFSACVSEAMHEAQEQVRTILAANQAAGRVAMNASSAH